MMTPAPTQAAATPVRRAVAACPWCGAGSELTTFGDGFGGIALCCTRCGARGPTAAVDGDFAAADEAAIALWSRRPRTPQASPDILARLRVAVGLHRLGGTLSPDASVNVPWSDLDALMRFAGGAGQARPA